MVNLLISFRCILRLLFWAFCAAYAFPEAARHLSVTVAFMPGSSSLPAGRVMRTSK